MSALERLQDLLERATPLPWVKTTDAHGHGPASDGPCWSSTVTAGDYVVSFVDDLDATADADTDLIALAPVIASDLIALAEAAQVVVDDRTNTGAGDGNVYCRRCDYPIVDGVCGMRAGTRKNDWTCSTSVAPATSLEGYAQ